MTKTTPKAQPSKRPSKPKRSVKPVSVREIPIPKGSKPRSDKMAHLLYDLMQRTARDKDFQQKGFLVSVRSRDLIALIGTHYSKIVQDATALGFIEVNHSYSKGELTKDGKPFPKSFRLTELFRTGEWEMFSLEGTLKLKSRINLTTRDGMGHLLVKSFRRVKPCGKDHEMSIWDRLLMYQIQVGDIYAKRCTYRRFHSTFTNLSKKARLGLQTREGVSLREVDVSNCQPLLLCSLLGSGHVEPGFRDLCQSGTLYDHMATRFGLSRDDLKEQFIPLLFSKTANMPNSVIYEGVKRLYPRMIRKIEGLKEQDHTTLSHKLQELESKIMIDGVCGQLLETHPKIAIVTVHDSILCEPSYVDVVKRLIKESFEKHGLTPDVRVS